MQDLVVWYVLKTARPRGSNRLSTINVCFGLRVFSTLRLLLPMAMLIVFWYMLICEISKNGEFLS